MKATLWTIQPASLVEALRSKSELYVCEKLMRRGQAPEAYKWLVSQLSIRNPNCFTGRFTWWAYLVKPDLRKMRFLLGKGSYVRIQLKKDTNSFVSFPVWAWNTVYGGAYLAKSSVENQDWERRLGESVSDWEDLSVLPPPWQKEVEESWASLFDSDLPRAVDWDEMFSNSRAEVAVFEELHFENIESYDYFEAKGSLIP